VIIDCLVEGRYDSQEVVVIGEVKMNMAQKHTDAVAQLRGNLTRWELLCSHDPAELDAIAHSHDQKDIALCADYRNLQLAKLRGRRVLFAVGGALSPPELDSYFNKNIPKDNKPWLQVTLDGAVAIAVGAYA